MCGRYTMASPDEVIAEFGLEPGLADAPGDAGGELAPRYNIAPTQLAPIVTAAAPQRLVAARWGLIPRWAADPGAGSRLINARMETAAHRPSFRDAFRRRRCLVVADGYFEWKREGRSKTPHYIRTASGRPLAFAGLWDRWRAPDGSERTSFAILTRDADDLVAPIHHRMPVILGASARARWLAPGALDAGAGMEILRAPEPPEMRFHAVSTAVNSPAVDAPACIEPVRRQPGLFDGL